MAKRSTKSARRAPDASMRIVVLHGSDAYLLAEYARVLSRSLEEAHGEIERFDFDGRSIGLAEVLDELNSFGLIQSHKLVVVEEADAFLKAGGNRAAMERYAESPSDAATLLLRAPRWNRGRIDKLIEAVGAVIKCEAPSAGEAITWSMVRAKKRHGVELAQNAANALVDRVGPDLARLDSELGKLSAAVDPPEGPIALDLVEAMVGRSREDQAWVVQSAVLQGGARGAMASIAELLEIARVPDELLNWALLDLARKIAEVSDAVARGVSAQSAAKSAGLWGPAAAQVTTLARRVPPRRAAAVFESLVENDRRVKSGITPGGRRSIERCALAVASLVD